MRAFSVLMCLKAVCRVQMEFGAVCAFLRFVCVRHGCCAVFAHIRQCVRAESHSAALRRLMAQWRTAQCVCSCASMSERNRKQKRERWMDLQNLCVLAAERSCARPIRFSHNNKQELKYCLAFKCYA